jgi:hypothetical protein
MKLFKFIRTICIDVIDTIIGIGIAIFGNIVINVVGFSSVLVMTSGLIANFPNAYILINICVGYLLASLTVIVVYVLTIIGSVIREMSVCFWDYIRTTWKQS